MIPQMIKLRRRPCRSLDGEHAGPGEQTRRLHKGPQRSSGYRLIKVNLGEQVTQCIRSRSGTRASKSKIRDKDGKNAKIYLDPATGAIVTKDD